MNPLWQLLVLLVLTFLVGVPILRRLSEMSQNNRTLGVSVIWFFVWLALLIELVALPITSWLFPLFGDDGARWLGTVLLGTLIGFFFLSLAVHSIFEKGGAAKFWNALWSQHEKVLLRLLPRKHHDHYRWHVRWRFVLLGRKITRRWERFSLKKFLVNQRWFWVLLAGTLAASMALYVVAEGVWFALPTPDNLKHLRDSSGSWTLLTALISAPIAFAIWWFRDTNTLRQIENQRKDTNLKDFQKLSEWVSGLHLIEWEMTRKSDSKEGFDHASQHEWHSRTKIKEIQEKFTWPMQYGDNKAMRPPSRTEGAASLQIAAVYQLQAFLRGDYGEHFQRPAFALLKTVWLSLVQAHASSWQHAWTEVLAKGASAAEEERKPFNDWQQNLGNLLQSPLAVAINDALTREHGRALQDHAGDLSSGVFAGLQAKALELDGLHLQGIQLQGAHLRDAQLQGAHLRYAQLQGADLFSVQLQGANLSAANLQGANLLKAQLQGANLRYAKLQGADLRDAKLQGADLWSAELQGTNLIRAQLKESNLQGAQLHNAFLLHTNLQNADLSEANLKDVDLSETNLQGANLSFAQLQGARFFASQLEGLNLSDEQRASIIVEEE